jgi:phospholipase/carboxylesterase
MSPLSAIDLDLADIQPTVGRGGSGTAADGGAAAIDDGWTGCLLHGFGASANDLVGLAPELGRARYWIFPHAPVPITVAGMSYGRACFPGTTETWSAHCTAGTSAIFVISNPGVARRRIRGPELLAQRDVDWSRLILGGFSQGAMVTAEVLRQSLADPSLPTPAVAILFSGALTAAGWWQGLSLGGTGATRPAPHDLPRILQSHGDVDPVLPMADGEALRDALVAAGYSVEWVPFHGRHEIPQEAIAAARAVIVRG